MSKMICFKFVFPSSVLLLASLCGVDATNYVLTSSGTGKGKFCYSYIEVPGCDNHEYWCWTRKSNGAYAKEGADDCKSYDGYGTSWCYDKGQDLNIHECKSNTHTYVDLNWQCPSGWYEGSAPSDAAAAKKWTLEINIARCMHNAPFAKWSETIGNRMAGFVAQMNSNKLLQHSNSYYYGCGENIAMSYPATDLEAKSVNMWYDEYNNCPSPLHGCQHGSGTTGHFTALVWKGVSAIGCSLGSAGYAGCQFRGTSTTKDCTTPNMDGCYQEQVNSLQNSFAECKAALEGCLGVSSTMSLYDVDEMQGMSSKSPGILQILFGAGVSCFTAVGLVMFAVRTMRKRRERGILQTNADARELLEAGE